MAEKYQVVVIGSGPGGYVAAIRAAQLGFKVACIEKESSLGGTCLNVGCIPSKALLQSTEYYEWLCHSSQEHAISCKNPEIDFEKLMNRKEKIVSGLTGGISFLFKKNNIAHIKGKAKLLSPNEIEVDDGVSKKTIGAENIILATGSEPISLPFLPFDEKIIVSSTGALSLPSIPKEMLVIGGGVIGVELASVYNRLGTKVTIVEMLDRICPGMDEDLSKALLQILKKQGMEFYLGCKVTDAKKSKTGITLSVHQGEKQISLQGNVVLVAVGRKPFTNGLGLQEVGIQMNKGMVNVDSNFRTNIKNIYAIGDLIDGPMLAHKASEEGVAAVEIIAGKNPHLNYAAIPNVIYTHPEVASLGATEAFMKESNLQYSVGKSFFRGNSRARCSGYTEGFVKVIGAGKENRLVGMHLIGPQVSEMINVGVLGIEDKTTLERIATSPLAHPTLSEALKEACGQALGRAIHE